MSLVGLAATGVAALAATGVAGVAGVAAVGLWYCAKKASWTGTLFCAGSAMGFWPEECVTGDLDG